jgi:hypothetical protein
MAHPGTETFTTIPSPTQRSLVNTTGKFECTRGQYLILIIFSESSFSPSTVEAYHSRPLARHPAKGQQNALQEVEKGNNPTLLLLQKLGSMRTHKYLIINYN